LDSDVDQSLSKNSSLEGISGERIRDEFIKGIKSSKSTIHFLQLIDKYRRWNFENNDNKTFPYKTFPPVVEKHSDIIYCVDYGINVFNNVTIKMYNKIGNVHTQINYEYLQPLQIIII
jgi:hypothetical protein